MGEAKPCKQRPNIGSRVTREGHARFWERRRRNSSGRLDKLRRNAVAPPLPVNPQQRKFLAGDRHSRSVPRTDISGAFPKASHYSAFARRTRLASPGQRSAIDLQSLARSKPWALEVPLLRRPLGLPLRGKLPGWRRWIGKASLREHPTRTSPRHCQPRATANSLIDCSPPPGGATRESFRSKFRKPSALIARPQIDDDGSASSAATDM